MLSFKKFSKLSVFALWTFLDYVDGIHQSYFLPAFSAQLAHVMFFAKLFMTQSLRLLQIHL